MKKIDDLTAKEKVELHNRFETLVKLSTFGKGIDFELAKLLYEFKKDDHFKLVMGYPEATWKAFCDMAELQPLTLSKADRLVKIYSTYIVNLGLKPEDIRGVDSHALHRIAGRVNKKNVREWLEKAKVLSRADFQRELRFGNVDISVCKHSFGPKVDIIKTCMKCGEKYKEHGTNEK